MLTSFGLMMWLGLSTQIAKSQGIVSSSQLKPFNNDNCLSNNVTSESLTLSDSDQQYVRPFSFTKIVVILFSVLAIDFPFYRTEEAFILLKISYLWYTVIGMMIVLTLGTLVSFITKAMESRRQPSQQSLDSVVPQTKTPAIEVCYIIGNKSFNVN